MLEEKHSMEKVYGALVMTLGTFQTVVLVIAHYLILIIEKMVMVLLIALVQQKKGEN